MNKNWKTHWKAHTLNKDATALHHFQYCVLKALGAKSNAKLEIAQALLRRAFTPVKEEIHGRTAFDTVRRVNYQAIWHWRNTKQIFGLDASLFFNAEDEEAYVNLVGEIYSQNIAKSEPEYMFVFVRQDISPEQQAVQAAHATYKAGCTFGYNPDTTNFVLVGLPKEEHVTQAANLCEANGHETVSFIEPDLGDTLTAIAVRPMKERHKRFLREYKKLVF